MDWWMLLHHWYIPLNVQLSSMMNGSWKDEEATIYYCLVVIIITAIDFLRPVMLPGKHCVPLPTLEVVCQKKELYTRRFIFLAISTYHLKSLYSALRTKRLIPSYFIMPWWECVVVCDSMKILCTRQVIRGFTILSGRPGDAVRSVPESQRNGLRFDSCRNSRDPNCISRGLWLL